jgi:hypothetical protein
MKKDAGGGPRFDAHLVENCPVFFRRQAGNIQRRHESHFIYSPFRSRNIGITRIPVNALG